MECAAWESGGIHDVRKNAAGIDGGKLIAVAQQDNTRMWRQGVEEFRHEGQRDHGSLIDNQQIERERISCVMPELC